MATIRTAQLHYASSVKPDQSGRQLRPVAPTVSKKQSSKPSRKDNLEMLKKRHNRTIENMQKFTDADRNALIRYFASKECQLTVMAKLMTNSEELDKILRASGGVQEALTLLRKLNNRGVRVFRLGELIPKILNSKLSKFQASDEERLIVFEYLSASSCQLFNSGAMTHGMEMKTSAKELDQLIEAGGGTSIQLIELLSILDEGGWAFTSVPSIIPALPEAAKLVERTQHLRKLRSNEMKRQRVEICKYLSSAECHLFGSIHSLETTANDLDNLLMHGHGFMNTMYILHHLNDTGEAFSSVADIVPVVKNFARNGEIDRHKIFLFLNKYRWILFRESNIHVTEEVTDRVYYESKAGPHTYSFLQLYKNLGHRFDGFEDLINSLHIAFLQKIEQKQLMIQHKPIVDFFILHRSALFIPAAEDHVLTMTSSYFSSLLEETNNSRSTLLILLQELQEGGHIFDSAHDLLQSVKMASVSMNTVKEQVEKYLRPLNGAKIHAGLLPRKAAEKITDCEACFIMVQTHAGTATLQYLQELQEFHKVRFASVEELISEVREMHSTAVKTHMEQLKLVKQFIIGPVSRLFYKTIDLSEASLRQLLPLHCNVPLTFFVLHHLNAFNVQVSDMSELIREVNAERVLLMENLKGQWENEIRTYVSDVIRVNGSEQEEKVLLSLVDEIVHICSDDLFIAYLYYTEFRLMDATFNTIDSILGSFYQRHCSSLERESSQAIQTLILVNLMSTFWFPHNTNKRHERTISDASSLVVSASTSRRPSFVANVSILHTIDDMLRAVDSVPRFFSIIQMTHRSYELLTEQTDAFERARRLTENFLTSVAQEINRLRYLKKSSDPFHITMYEVRERLQISLFAVGIGLKGGEKNGLSDSFVSKLLCLGDTRNSGALPNILEIFDVAEKKYNEKRLNGAVDQEQLFALLSETKKIMLQENVDKIKCLQSLFLHAHTTLWADNKDMAIYYSDQNWMEMINMAPLHIVVFIMLKIALEGGVQGSQSLFSIFKEEFSSYTSKQDAIIAYFHSNLQVRDKTVPEVIHHAEEAKSPTIFEFTNGIKITKDAYEDLCESSEPSDILDTQLQTYALSSDELASNPLLDDATCDIVLVDRRISAVFGLVPETHLESISASFHKKISSSQINWSANSRLFRLTLMTFLSGPWFDLVAHVGEDDIRPRPNEEMITKLVRVCSIETSLASCSFSSSEYCNTIFYLEEFKHYTKSKVEEDMSSSLFENYDALLEGFQSYVKIMRGEISKILQVLNQEAVFEVDEYSIERLQKAEDSTLLDHVLPPRRNIGDDDHAFNEHDAELVYRHGLAGMRTVSILRQLNVMSKEIGKVRYLSEVIALIRKYAEENPI